MDYEKIYLKLIQIFAEQEDIKVEVNFERRWKQMKRTWKNFKLDPNKVYMRIGQAVTYIAFNLLLSAFMVWGFLQGMTY